MRARHVQHVLPRPSVGPCRKYRSLAVLPHGVPASASAVAPVPRYSKEVGCVAQAYRCCTSQRDCACGRRGMHQRRYGVGGLLEVVHYCWCPQLSGAPSRLLFLLPQRAVGAGAPVVRSLTGQPYCLCVTTEMLARGSVGAYNERPHGDSPLPAVLVKLPRLCRNTRGQQSTSTLLPVCYNGDAAFASCVRVPAPDGDPEACTQPPASLLACQPSGVGWCANLPIALVCTQSGLSPYQPCW